MVKRAEKTDVAVPEEQKKKAGLGRVFGRWWRYVLVVFFAMLLSVGVWSRPDQVMLGDDYAFHVSRLESTTHALVNGQTLPQVDPEALDGFGYAYNLFYGPILTYLAAGLEFLIGSWPIVVNLILVLCLAGAGITMCYAMTRVTKNRMLALLIAVIYMASPYLLNNIYSRMALGEVAAAVAAPILLLGLYQLTAREKHASRSLAVAAALLILSHSLSAMLFALMGGVYVLLNVDKVFNVRSIWRMILAVVVALGLSAFFTLPLIEARLEGDYGVFDQDYAEAFFGANPQSMNDHRVWPQQLVALGATGEEYGIALGMMAMIGILGFWFVWRTIEDRTERRFVTSLYIIAILAIFAMLPIVDWKYLPSVFWNMQFPWRLMMIAMTALSVVAGYTMFALVRRVSAEKQLVFAIMVGVLAVYTVAPVVLPDETRHLEDFGKVEEDLATVGFQAEYAPVMLLCDASSEADRERGYACSLERIRKVLAGRGTKVEVVSGQARLNKAVKDGLRVEFEVRNTEERGAVAELPLIWYPGYRAWLDDVELVVGRSEEYGLVTVEIPAGMRGKVKVDYELTRPTEVGMLVSVATAGLGIIWVMITAVYDWRKRRKQREVDTLIDSVWEAMAESEKLHDAMPDAVAKAKPVRSAATARKRSGAKKTSTKAAKAEVGEVIEKKPTAKTTTTRKTTKAKSTKVKAKTETAEAEKTKSLEDEVTKPRVTKVKARTKKEV